MKKLILPFIAISMLFAACGETATQEEKTTIASEQKQESSEPKKEENTASTGKYSSPEVQKFADEYEQFVKSFIETAKTKDVAKIAELNNSAADWTKKVQEITGKLTPEDAKLWGEMVQKYSAEMQSAIQGK